MSSDTPAGPAISATMPPMAAAASPSLTLIVATTPSFGIGRSGTLPWPQLRAEMAYFARVTRRTPSPRHVNAVIMGRKTWDSIPARFRPLKGRLNIVVSRTMRLGRDETQQQTMPGLWDRVQWSSLSSSDETRTGIVSVTSLQDAVRELSLGPARDSSDSAVPTTSTSTSTSTSTDDPLDTTMLYRAYVIGGADIYRAALDLPQADRVLRTKILTEFECDVHFPLNLQSESQGWQKASRADLDLFVGEHVPEGEQTEKDVSWEFELWERR